MEVYNDFNFRALYDLIVDFLEVPGGTEAERRVAKLLEWWNWCVILLLHPSSKLTLFFCSQVFPHHVGAATNTRKSRNKLALQRAAREPRESSVEI